MNPALRPEVVLTDIRMPPTNTTEGIVAAKTGGASPAAATAADSSSMWNPMRLRPRTVAARRVERASPTCRYSDSRSDRKVTSTTRPSAST